MSRALRTVLPVALAVVLVACGGGSPQELLDRAPAAMEEQGTVGYQQQGVIVTDESGQVLVDGTIAYVASAEIQQDSGPLALMHDLRGAVEEVDALPRRIVTVTTRELRTDLYDYGEPVDVTAPAEDDVVDFSELLAELGRSDGAGN